jgi:tetratricopeptide (TPR) repeat protein
MKIKTVLFFILCYIGLFGQGLNLDNKYRLAQSYEQAGMLEKAKEIYLDIYNQAKNNFLYFEGLNRVLLTLKDYESSEKILKERINANPYDINNYGLLGSTYYLMNNQEEAFKTWDNALKLNTGQINIYRIIANYAIQNRAFDKGIEYLRRGMEISNDKFIFAYDIGNLLIMTMKYEEAADEFCKILVAQPSQTENIKSRIAPYLTQQEAIDKVLEVVKRYIKDNDKNYAFYELQTFLLIQKDDYKNGFESVINWDKLTNSYGAKIYNFANEALSENNFEYAAKAFDFIIKNYPSGAYVPMSKIGYVRSLYQALKYKYEEINPDWKEYSLPDTTGAFEYLPIIDTYRLLIKDYENNVDIKTEALYYIGEIYLDNLNLPDSAKRYFTEISEKYPISAYSGKALFKLADIAILKGDLIAAEACYDKILLYRRVTPGEIKETEFKKAKISFWQNDIEKAISRLNNVIKDLNENIANDAVSLLLTINTLKNDSLSLLKYAQADLFANKKEFNAAANIYLSLTNTDDVIFQKNLALYNYSLMLIALNDYNKAVIFLENLSNNENMNIFVDKSLFLLANLYQYGLKDLQKAKLMYEAILEKFPNSLYLDKARNFLNNYK